MDRCVQANLRRSVQRASSSGWLSSKIVLVKNFEFFFSHITRIADTIWWKTKQQVGSYRRVKHMIIFNVDFAFGCCYLTVCLISTFKPYLPINDQRNDQYHTKISHSD